MADPGIPAQQMQRTGTHTLVCRSGMDRHALTKHAQMHSRKRQFRAHTQPGQHLPPASCRNPTSRHSRCSAQARASAGLQERSGEMCSTTYDTVLAALLRPGLPPPRRGATSPDWAARWPRARIETIQGWGRCPTPLLPRAWLLLPIHPLPKPKLGPGRAGWGRVLIPAVSSTCWGPTVCESRENQPAFRRVSRPADYVRERNRPRWLTW